MLIKTASLRRLLEKDDMTSYQIKKAFWDRDGNIYALLPEDCFVRVTWDELPRYRYGVLSYMWGSPWHPLVHFILDSESGVLQPYMWVDIKCLDQLSKDKMKTIQRSDEIYHHAKEYHLMELGSLFRGWVLFELASVKPTMLPPITHYTTKDPVAIKMVLAHLRRTGFDGSEFTDEADRAVVKKKILDTYGSVEKFNEKIISIVDNILKKK